MKPLISEMPMVGGLQVFFLNNPIIDFDLVGVADLLDMPGLSDLLRRIIVEQVAAMMVLPNKLPIQLSDAVPAAALKTPEPEGVLRIHVVEAKDLMKKDIGVLGKGKSDPYAVIQVGAQEFRTKIIDNTVNPKWDFWCEVSFNFWGLISPKNFFSFFRSYFIRALLSPVRFKWLSLELYSGLKLLIIHFVNPRFFFIFYILDRNSLTRSGFDHHFERSRRVI